MRREYQAAMKEKDPFLDGRHRPSAADQLVALLMSVGLSLVVLLVGISAGRLVELVLVLITAFAVLAINVLFAFSRWESRDEGRTRVKE